MGELDDLEEFKDASGVSGDDWTKADISWEDLRSIGLDHRERSPMLQKTAEFLGGMIQSFPLVHSVRWRVKDPVHLMAKIVRKRADRVEKYLNISLDTYADTVTDLVGLRALHLFKSDCFPIDRSLRETWDPVEEPVAYLRSGDAQDLYSERGFKVAEHPSGYRSVHYVIASQPVQRRILSEVQVRTIFEEGWSEIDHRVRYPNYSKHELLGGFLDIFNRLAGSADEMGSFVQVLVERITGLEESVRFATRAREQTLVKMDEALQELEQTKQSNADFKSHIEILRAELSRLQGAASATKGQGTQGAEGTGGDFLRLAGVVLAAFAGGAMVGGRSQTEADNGNVALPQPMRPPASSPAQVGGTPAVRRTRSVKK